MRIALVIPHKGFRDETVVAVRDFLQKWHIEPVIVSPDKGTMCHGYHGAVVHQALNVDMVRTVDFDGIFLADGPGIDQYQMYDYRPLLDIVRHFYEGGKIVAGVGNAIKILARANIITDLKIAAPKDEESRRLATLYRGVLTKNPIETEKTVITLGKPEALPQFLTGLLHKLGVE